MRRSQLRIVLVKPGDPHVNEDGELWLPSDVNWGAFVHPSGRQQYFYEVGEDDDVLC